MTTAIHQPHLQPCTKGSTDDIGAAKSILLSEFWYCEFFEYGLSRLEPPERRSIVPGSEGKLGNDVTTRGGQVPSL